MLARVDLDRLSAELHPVLDCVCEEIAVAVDRQDEKILMGVEAVMGMVAGALEAAFILAFQPSSRRPLQKKSETQWGKAAARSGGLRRRHQPGEYRPVAIDENIPQRASADEPRG